MMATIHATPSPIHRRRHMPRRRRIKCSINSSLQMSDLEMKSLTAEGCRRRNRSGIEAAVKGRCDPALVFRSGGTSRPSGRETTDNDVAALARIHAVLCARLRVLRRTDGPSGHFGVDVASFDAGHTQGILRTEYLEPALRNDQDVAGPHVHVRRNVSPLHEILQPHAVRLAALGRAIDARAVAIGEI